MLLSRTRKGVIVGDAMGLFNSLRTEARCPICGWEGFFEVQFKSGHTDIPDYTRTKSEIRAGRGISGR